LHPDSIEIDGDGTSGKGDFSALLEYRLIVIETCSKKESENTQQEKFKTGTLAK
jgi:hypothetical protein